MSLPEVAVVGAGRVGLSLARALARSGHRTIVLSRRARPLPDPLPPATDDPSSALRNAEVVIIAAPDDAIMASTAALARTGAVTERHTVLHCSGFHDRRALQALDGTGAALGSLHPLMTFLSSEGEPDLLVGAPGIVEGDPRAVAVARQVAAAVGLDPVVELPGDRKPAYHAGAVFASNYLVVLAAVAARLGGTVAGVESLYLPIMQRTVENLSAHRIASALTGPIRRGDAGTVAAHLAALSGPERALYVALGREALMLAREAGLDPGAAARIDSLLTAR